MLENGKLYENRIGTELLTRSFDPNYQWYYSGIGLNEFSIPIEATSRHFASTTANGKLIGYISYQIDQSTYAALNFGIISFDMGNPEFIKDVRKVIRAIFERHGMNKLEFFAYADSPHLRGYRKLIKRFGGHEVGTLHDTTRLSDGKLHDTVIFEIMAEDYKHVMKKRV